MAESVLFSTAFGVYIICAFFYFLFLFTTKNKWSNVALYLAAAGLTVHFAALVLRTVISGRAPFTNMYESISFLSWAIVGSYILIIRKFPYPKIGPYLMLVVIALMAVASSPLMPKDIMPLVPALQSYWLWLHVSVTLLGESFLAMAFVASILYLKARDSDKMEKLDAICYRSVAIGFPLFTLGALIFGMIWAYKAWGRYWGWDPKEVWSLITWFVYALYLHTRIVMGWKGKRSAIIAIIGFLAALFTFFGVNYLLSGLHSYL